jgi:dihydroneopterin aldolase/2-amino-4-hydroxy-6-hydroxymethyldihydropteridine diphosphokinase/dihydropteroate synthase
VFFQTICSSNFQTLEALTSLVASKTLTLLRSVQPAASVLVRIAKPSALVFAGTAEVQIRRTLDDYPDDDIPQSHSLCSSSRVLNHPHTAAIALGSNMGDSFHNIEYALRLLEDPLQILKDENISVDANPFVDVVNTSFLYETKPMYVTDQPSFINGSCMVRAPYSAAVRKLVIVALTGRNRFTSSSTSPITQSNREESRSCSVDPEWFQGC